MSEKRVCSNLRFLTSIISRNDGTSWVTTPNFIECEWQENDLVRGKDSINRAEACTGCHILTFWWEMWHFSDISDNLIAIDTFYKSSGHEEHCFIYTISMHLPSPPPWLRSKFDEEKSYARIPRRCQNIPPIFFCKRTNQLSRGVHHSNIKRTKFLSRFKRISAWKVDFW